jgi:hypothetical protein
MLHWILLEFYMNDTSISNKFKILFFDFFYSCKFFNYCFLAVTTSSSLTDMYDGAQTGTVLICLFACQYTWRYCWCGWWPNQRLRQPSTQPTGRPIKLPLHNLVIKPTTQPTFPFSFPFLQNCTFKPSVQPTVLSYQF